MVMIYDINSKLKNEDAKSEICTWNIRGCNITKADFRNEFQIKMKHKAKWSGKNTG